jgi:hypothetical protein
MTIHDERCELCCPTDTPWSCQAKAVSWLMAMTGVKTRCTLIKGHTGSHLGPDESRWDGGVIDTFWG